MLLLILANYYLMGANGFDDLILQKIRKKAVWIHGGYLTLVGYIFGLAAISISSNSNK